VTSAVPTDQTLHLKKEKGKWLVEWTKQDQMNGSESDSTSAEEEPAMGDSTAAPEAEQQPADTSTAK
jgi:hypothetical protein